ncbi:MAG: lipopolysaccharide biosynthesis protein [Bosea sp.]|nr:lipopolysaccharide biosynthesis protein [Bosea sp. (in: a-proteobacteria)]
MSGIRSSFIFSLAEKYASQMLLIGTTAVMARLLTPAETGLFLTANAVILLADNFRAFGVGTYLVQEKEIDRALVRSAFTLTLLFSFVCAALTFAFSDTVAGLYGAPALGPLLAASSLAFLLTPISGPVIALMQRELAFGRIAFVNVSSALAGSAMTIWLGLNHHGAMSFVWGSVAASALMAILAFAMRPELSIFVPSLSRARRLLSFGTWSSLITILNMSYDLLPRLAFGRILGFDAVGLYARALTISQLPDRMLVSALQPVVLPALAAHVRAGGDLREGYLRGLSLTTAVHWPALIMLALLADPVVHLLLGPQWIEAAPLVRIIALANLALAPAFLTFPVLVAAGRIRDALLASLISLPPSFIIAIGAAFISLDAVAASMLIVAPLQMAVAYAFIRPAVDLSWRRLWRALQPSIALTLGAALPPGLLVLVSGQGFALDWPMTVIALAGGTAGWLVTLLNIEHSVKEELVGSTRQLLGRFARVRAPAE